MKGLQNLRRCRLLNPGLVEYGEAWGLQKELFHARSRDEIIDTLILLQHPPTYTFGRRSLLGQPILDETCMTFRGTNQRVPDFSLDRKLRLKPNTQQGFSSETIMSGSLTRDDENSLSLRERDRPDLSEVEGVKAGLFSGERDREEVSLYWVDRGGGATYHGPGQIVGYPILALRSYTSDYHTYLRMLEEIIIETLADFGIESQRLNGYTGVWVKGEREGGGGREGERGFSGERKIAFIGVRIARGITMHGFALNVNNDLEPFDRIIPCNIKGVKMTSMSRILRTTVNIPDVEESLIHNFALIFGVHFEGWSAF